MKKLTACLVLICLASASAPAAARAESVFDARALGANEPRFDAGPVAQRFGGLPHAGIASFDLAAAGSSQEPSRDVSAGRAALLSLLLPGLGEQRLGATLRAKVFYGLEGLAWLSCGSFLWMGYSREESYHDYAVAFAGVQGTDHSDDFYEAIGKYLASDGPGGYYETIRRDARDYYYPDVAAMEAYYRANAMSQEGSWSWESLEVFRNYASLRSGSRTAYRVALYSAVFAAALRVVSAADAVRLARMDDRSRDNDPAVSIGLERMPRGVAVYLQRSF